MSIPERIYEGIDSVLEISKHDRDQLLKTINGVIAQIETMLVAPEYAGAFSDRAELLYLLGYTYYLHPDRMGSMSSLHPN